MANDSAKYRFDKTLTELQAGLKVLPVGVAPVGAWKYAFRYEILARWYPDLAERARPITRREAQKALMLRHLKNVVAATRAEVFKALDVLGWTKREFESAVGRVVEECAVHETHVEGVKGALLVVTSS